MLLRIMVDWLYRRYRAQLSFSQCGEDIFLRRLLARMGVTRGTYLDIGANDPRHLNNTYLLYLHDFSGVLVEPEPGLARRLRRIRPRDHVIQAGVAGHSSPAADFFVMSNPFFHTFSREEAELIGARGTADLLRVIQVPIYSINELLQHHCPLCPNLVSLDAEGLDREIIAVLDFSRFRPEIFCIEAVAQQDFFDGTRNQDIAAILRRHGYMEIGRLQVNSIFVDREKWIHRRSHA